MKDLIDMIIADMYPATPGLSVTIYADQTTVNFIRKYNPAMFYDPNVPKIIEVPNMDEKTIAPKPYEIWLRASDHAIVAYRSDKQHDYFPKHLFIAEQLEIVLRSISLENDIGLYAIAFPQGKGALYATAVKMLADSQTPNVAFYINSPSNGAFDRMVSGFGGGNVKYENPAEEEKLLSELRAKALENKLVCYVFAEELTPAMRRTSDFVYVLESAAFASCVGAVAVKRRGCCVPTYADLINKIALEYNATEENPINLHLNDMVYNRIKAVSPELFEDKPKAINIVQGCDMVKLLRLGGNVTERDVNGSMVHGRFVVARVDGKDNFRWL